MVERVRVRSKHAHGHGGSAARSMGHGGGAATTARPAASIGLVHVQGSHLDLIDCMVEMEEAWKCAADNDGGHGDVNRRRRHVSPRPVR
jgi:hypothetical protein